MLAVLAWCLRVFGPGLYDAAYGHVSVYDAETGDCVWQDQDDPYVWGVAPCAFPKLDAHNYKVLLRVDGSTDPERCARAGLSAENARAFPAAEMVLCLGGK
jgi:hypothetical protein